MKEYKPINELIERLKGRGMQLDFETAKQWLCSVGYYRLSAYWYPYRELLAENPPRRGDVFIPGTSFQDVATLYEFDRKLRTLVHDGIERIEIGLRTQINEHLGEVSGALAHKNPQNFRPSFDHAGWLTLAHKRVTRARRHNEAIRHHDTNYRGQMPVWVLSEVLDFSDISKLYEGLPVAAQYKIAENLGVELDLAKLTRNQRSKAKKHHPLVRWFEHLTIVRNTAAHHARLWNRSFTPVPTAALRSLREFQSLPEGQNERVYGALCVMNVLLARLSPNTSWPLKVRELLEDTLSTVSYRQTLEMGCPPGWQDDPIWDRK